MCVRFILYESFYLSSILSPKTALRIYVKLHNAIFKYILDITDMGEAKHREESFFLWGAGRIIK